MFKIIIWSIILTVIVRFIFRFVLPVFRITSTVQDRMRQMQQQMNDMQQNNTPPAQPKPKKVDGDYIDYEEVK
jgi:uncharacterized membrane protein (DUF106 family)